MTYPTRSSADEHLYRGYVIVISPKSYPDVRAYHGTIHRQIGSLSLLSPAVRYAAHYVEGETKEDVRKAAERLIDELED